MPKFKPNLYLPSNIRRDKKDNNLITEIKNNAISLIDWLGIDLVNGSTTKFLSEKGTYESVGNTITVDNGLTKTDTTITLGGSLTENTTISVSGFDYKLQDSTEGITVGIYESVLTGNKVWQAEHTNGGFYFSIINKAEVFPIGAFDYDGIVSVAKEDASNQTAAIGVVKRVGTDDLYQIFVWTDPTGIDGYYTLIGKDGIEMYGSGNTKILQIDNKTIFAILPEYANDAAADADATLPVGGLYKVVGNRAIYQKP